jgi:hypothetical protein
MLTKAILLLATAGVLVQTPAETLDQVLHFTNAETDRQLQEIATDIRGITEIPKVSANTAQRTLTLHGTAAQIALAEWLLNQWENPTQQPHEYRLSGDDIVHTFFLAHSGTAQRLQETATDIRTISDIRRLFVYNAQSAITVRGTAAQVALSEWLVSELDQPANQPPRTPAPHEYRLSGSVEDFVRVLYPTHTGTPQGLQEMATNVRTIGFFRRLMTHNGPSALIVRGTASEIALAGWLVNQLDQPANQPPHAPAPHEYRPSGTVDDLVRVFFLTHAQSPQRLQQIATEVRATAEIKQIFTYNALSSLIARGSAAQIALAERLIGERDQ